MIESYGPLGTFYVIPTDLEAHSKLYSELKKSGHEIGLHVHPVAQGYHERNRHTRHL